MANQLTAKISATDLARNLSSVIDKVRMAHSPMTITKGNQDIAQIVPIIYGTVSLGDLALMLKKHQLSQQQKQAFADDLSTIRQSAELPSSSWD